MHGDEFFFVKKELDFYILFRIEVCGGQSGGMRSAGNSVFPVNIIPSLLHIYLRFQTAPLRITCDRRLGTFKSSNALPELGALKGKYLMLLFWIFKDSTVAKAVSRWPLTTASRIRARVCLRVNRGG